MAQRLALLRSCAHLALMAQYAWSYAKEARRRRLVTDLFLTECAPKSPTDEVEEVEEVEVDELEEWWILTASFLDRASLGNLRCTSKHLHTLEGEPGTQDHTVAARLAELVVTHTLSPNADVKCELSDERCCGLRRTRFEFYSRNVGVGHRTKLWFCLKCGTTNSRLNFFGPAWPKPTVAVELPATVSEIALWRLRRLPAGFQAKVRFSFSPAQIVATAILSLFSVLEKQTRVGWCPSLVLELISYPALAFLLVRAVRAACAWMQDLGMLVAVLACVVDILIQL